jgi:hypothetical protein
MAEPSNSIGSDRENREPESKESQRCVEFFDAVACIVGKLLPTAELLANVTRCRYRANLAILLSFGRKGLSSERNEIHRTNSPITDLGVQSQLGLLGQLVGLGRAPDASIRHASDVRIAAWS